MSHYDKTEPFRVEAGWSAYLKHAGARFRDLIADTDADARCGDMFDPEIEAHAALMKACAREQSGVRLQMIRRETDELRGRRTELEHRLRDLHGDLSALERELEALRTPARQLQGGEL